MEYIAIFVYSVDGGIWVILPIAYNFMSTLQKNKICTRSFTWALFVSTISIVLRSVTIYKINM